MTASQIRRRTGWLVQGHACSPTLLVPSLAYPQHSPGACDGDGDSPHTLTIWRAAAGPVRGRAAAGAGGAGGPEGARVEPTAALPRPQRLPQAHRAAHRAGCGSCSHHSSAVWASRRALQHSCCITLHQLIGGAQKRGSFARSVLERAKRLILSQHLTVSVGPCTVPLAVHAFECMLPALNAALETRHRWC